ncbi:unnamed protein product [Candida verbasci]|uniref:Uncharacterized protein n=1 Tax=Candida verbasci TaxID=1227364 RepID=A0A9W4TPH9_9ASCO|nr:unnamed protein product [Candida verbasci]
MFSVSNKVLKPISNKQIVSKIIARNASINSGTSGSKTWPDFASFRRVLQSEPRKVFGWSIAFFIVLFSWPLATHNGSDYLDQVTKAKGQEVIATRTGFNTFETTVDIPQTYAPIDKEADDDE